MIDHHRKSASTTTLELEFPRINDLIYTINNVEIEFCYFKKFQETINSNPDKKKYMLRHESYLQRLDNESWTELQKELARRAFIRDEKRGWQALFDTWNEAIAYGYLSDIGCQNIKFIPRSRENGHKTPDIMGYLDGQEIICEAKRVNSIGC